MKDAIVPTPSNADHPITEVDAIKNVVDDKELLSQNQEVEDVSRHLHGIRLYALTFALMLSIMVVALDGSIINIAIPRITTDFGTLGDVGWYGSAYQMTQMGLQPTMGKVYTYFNVKWTLIVGVLTFEVGSILCATAQRSFMLVLGRAIAGAGTANIYNGIMSLIAIVVSMKNRALMVSVVTSMFAIAGILGPIVGGVFADSSLTWRFAFWINPPLGAITISLILLTVKNTPAAYPELSLKQKVMKLDIPGGAVLIGAVVCLLLALQSGGTKLPWSNSRVWGCLLGFSLLAMVFVGMQIYKKDEATFPPRVIMRRNVAVACVMALVVYMGFFSQVLFIPFYFQASKSMSAKAAGLRFIPYVISNTSGSLASGYIISRTGIFMPFGWAGSALFAVGSGLLYTLQVNSNAGQWIGYQIVCGFAYGMMEQIPLFSIQTALPKSHVAIGSSLFFFIQSLGGSIGLSSAQNIFSNELKRQLRGIDGIDFAEVNEAGASGIRDVVKGELLGVVLEAYNHALTKAFVLSIAGGSIGFVCSLTLKWTRIENAKKAPVTESEKV